MGGSAFSATKPASSFPRIPPVVYQDIKARYFSKLSQLYAYVGVPVEAPEKVDHGDIDFLVVFPKEPHGGGINVPHEVVKEAVGATFMVPMDGNRTSNFAVPISSGEWERFGSKDDEDKRRAEAEDNQIYYQVDVHVCESKNEWDRIMFYHSYGDLGMILGLIARNMGLKLGTSGLHIPDAPNPHFLLSNDFDDITSFLGLSKNIYDKGFNTKHEVFEWAASCKYYDPSHFKTSGQGFRKVKAERQMYYEFVEWIQEHRLDTDLSDQDDQDVGVSAHEELFDAKARKGREEALAYFGKKEFYEAIVHERDSKKRLKEMYSGSVVRDWTGLGGNWKAVKMIVDEVRQRLGGEEGILQFFDKEGIEKLREYVLGVQADLGIVSAVEGGQTHSDGADTLVEAVGAMELKESV